jgi:DNA-binding XRE family transcriptional regulator
MPKQNVSPLEHPQAVLQEIERLAQHIVVARKRRGETQAQWARKLGVSQPTMARIERGDPSVAMASYVMCLWLINPSLGLADLVAPAQDHAALEREVAKVRRQRRPRQAKASAPVQTVAEAAPPKPSQPTPTGASRAQGNAAAAGLAALLAATGKKTG